jgi:hypothetical protein
MKRVRQLFFCSMLIVLFLLSACATTTTTNVWRDQAYQGPVKKILVMGISKKQGVQRFFEDEFFRQLKQRGTDAVAGYSILQYDEKMDKDFIAAKAREIGADAVLVTRPLGRKTERAYMPGSPYYRGGGFYGYAYSPGYVVEDEYVYLETNLFVVATENLIWSAESETIILASDQELIKEFISTMIAKLASDKLIK